MTARPVLLPGTQCVIEDFGDDGALARHLLEIGITPGLQLTIVRRGPFGDPVEVAMPGTHSVVLRSGELASLRCRFVSGPLAALPCSATGRYRVRALAGGQRFARRAAGYGLQPGREFDLLPASRGRYRLRSGADAPVVELGRGEAVRLIVEPA